MGLASSLFADKIVDRKTTPARFWETLMEGQHTSAQVMAAGAVSTVGELFGAAAILHKNAIAIEYLERRISYGELLDRVQRATAMLASYGLQRGDRVALLSRNR